MTPKRRLRRFLRRHWLTIAVAATLSALAINVWIQNGGWVLVLIGCVSIGCTTVVFACAATSGHLVVKHSEQTQQAIESGKQKELTK